MQSLMLNAQEAKVTAKNTVYGGYARIGTYYFIGYDRIFNQGKHFNISYHAGVSLLKTNIAFPAGINFFTGKKQHHAEFSLSVVPYVERFNYLFKAGNLSDKKLYILPAAGYRLQHAGGGFFAKIQAGPFIYIDPPSDSNTQTDSKVYPGLLIGIGKNF